MPSYRDSTVAVETSLAGTVRAALLTPPGRGALAVVGVAGSGAASAVDRCFESRGGRVAERADGAICFGRWRVTPDSTGEELVVVRQAADRVEVQCHGGEAAAAAVLGSLVAGGAIAVGWEEWLRAAGLSEIELEARAAVAEAGGPKAARILCRQLAGGLDRELRRIEQLRGEGERAAAVARLLAAARVGLRLTQPWRVVVAGEVNAGKSSLVNAIAGHARCIVSPEPGTTRDLVTTRLVLGGWEVDLVDTAGLRDAGESIGAVERAGIARAAAARADADLVLWVVASDDAASARVTSQPGELLVMTKSDLAGADQGRGSVDAVWTSAVTGAGIEELAARIVERLVPEERDDPGLLAGPLPFTERQVGIIESMASRPSP
ncbi:MAG: GTPase [Planctomycetaceae bacterium]